MRNVARLAEFTPTSRERYVDLLRVASLTVVILGHWLMAVILIGGDGTIQVTNVLMVIPSIQPVTWVLQVMPIFFMVGGFSHATALASLRRRGGGYSEFVRSRVDRLLRPTIVFAGVWLAVSLCCEASGFGSATVLFAARAVAQPLWFVGVYLGIVAFAPVMELAHRRLGRWAPALPAALGLAACAVDTVRLGLGMPAAGYLNVALVWLAIHQIGFFYADGTLVRGGRRLAAMLAGTGFAATVALTTVGPYPVSMVGMPGERVSNMSPPTVALLTQAVGLIGVVLLLRAPASRWLARRRVWTAVIAANGLTMTAFLWHLSALLVVTWVTAHPGGTLREVGSVRWWLFRPLWLAVLAAVTAGFILVFRRADQHGATGPGRLLATGTEGGRWRTALASSGTALCAVGVLGFSTVGFGGILAGRTATLVVLPVTPLRSTALLCAGLAVLTATRWRSGASAPVAGRQGTSAPVAGRPGASAPVAGRSGTPVGIVGAVDG